MQISYIGVGNEAGRGTRGMCPHEHQAATPSLTDTYVAMSLNMYTWYSDSKTETVQSSQPPARKWLKQSVLNFSLIVWSCDAAASNSSTLIDDEASWSSNLDGASSSSR